MVEKKEGKEKEEEKEKTERSRRRKKEMCRLGWWLMVEEEVAGEEGVWCGEMVWIRERMRRERERVI